MEMRARTINNNVFCRTEAANMPCTPEAMEIFLKAKILYAPGKAANAGGVATSGLEMTENSIRTNFGAEKKWMKNCTEL